MQHCLCTSPASVRSGAFGSAVCRRSVRTVAPCRHTARVNVRHAVEEKNEAQTTTEKYGLEAGLVKVLTAKGDTKTSVSKTDQAKELLAQYGSAYLVTSISFALVSFTACYTLVTAGVDVAALLSQIGLDVKSGSTSEAVGTFAIAYAAHKALSPVRFPPTVALTPVVARWFKKDAGKDTGSTDSGSTDADNTTL